MTVQNYKRALLVAGNNKKVAVHDRIWRELSSPPGAKVHGIQDNAEQIGGNKPQLRCLKSNHANNYAIKCSNDPTFPVFLPDQNRGQNRKHAGKVIKS